MANPSKNLPPTMQLKPLRTVHTEPLDESDGDYEKVVSSTVDNPMDPTDGAVPGPSGSQRQEPTVPGPVPSLVLYETIKPKQKRRRKQNKVESSSDSSSNDENVILARIQATKRALEKAHKEKKAQTQGGQKRKKM